LKFWDASAVIPLLLAEPQRAALLGELERDPVMLVWWGTPVECVSAIARREREGALGAEQARAAIERLRSLSLSWQEVLPTDAVRATAQRLLRVHALRAADSLQLAAAVLAAERDPATLPLVSLDERLCDAAAREGFQIVRA
jgi:predicted nucleic acid-binding protein